MSQTLKIKFSITDIDSDRYVSFEDEVAYHRVRDFFERCGLTCEQLFCTMSGASVIRLVHKMYPGIAHREKIPAIKVTRQLITCSLKEAKDLVEGIYGGDLMWIANSLDGVDIVEMYRKEGCQVVVTRGPSVNLHEARLPKK